MGDLAAAVPRYVGQNFDDCPPGHRFNLYFQIWDKDKDWELRDKEKSAALQKTLALPEEAKRQLKALRERQRALAARWPQSAVLSIEAISIAPLATGLGIEHPLENGFAFLNPYGLAYLSGSSIKGVLRRAAEALGSEANEPEQPRWTPQAIDLMFGPEVGAHDDETQRRRGALSFWDALPEPAGEALGMDVMTPHFRQYYQGAGTPHDAGQPNPIVFLVVPPESRVSFHLVCDLRLLETHVALRRDWHEMLRRAFEHAFDWLGFGAKTAVGYGAMKRDVAGERALAEAAEARAASERAIENQRIREAMPELDGLCADLENCSNEADLHVWFPQLRQYQGEDQKRVARGFEAAYRQFGKWEGRQSPKQSSKIAEIKRILN